MYIQAEKNKTINKNSTFCGSRTKPFIKKNMGRELGVSQLAGVSWSEWMSHYWSKKDELGHVLTSGRRQFMQRTSASAKKTRKYIGKKKVPLDQIRLLHWTEHDDTSKTGKRRAKLKPVLERGDRIITENIIDETMGSKDLVQVAHMKDGEVYVTLEGVGRLLAIRTACSELKISYRDIEVEVELYEVSEDTMGSLLDVHKSYFKTPGSNEELDEDVWSHLYGVGRSLGWTLVGIGTVAALIKGGGSLIGGDVPPIPK